MADITTGYTFIDGEKGVTAAKENDQVGKAVINPEFVSAKPSTSTVDAADQLLVLKAAGTYARSTGQVLIDSVAGQLSLASTSQNGMLRQISGLTTDVVDGTNHCVDFASSPVFGMARVRSFNACGNPTFEINQQAPGQTITTNANVCDRWSIGKAGTLAYQATQFAPGPVQLPGTNFNVTRKCLRVTLTTAQASLAATDYLQIWQLFEGIQCREILNDAFSVSLLVRSSVAGLKFGFCILDPPTSTKSLVKLCTIPSANTWTLITLPNLPVFPAGNFSIAEAVMGLQFLITLAGGTTRTTSANDVWTNSGTFAAIGQDNFASKAVNSTFDLAFAQLEPGANCTTLIDKPYSANLDECLRYWQKSYHLATAPGTIATAGMKSFLSPTSTSAFGPLTYVKPMAKTPTITLYNHATGASGSVQDGAAANHASAAAAAISDAGFAYITYTTATGGLYQVYAHYVADTGW